MEERDIFDIFGDEFENHSTKKKRRMEDVEEQIITDNESRTRDLLNQLEKAVAEIEDDEAEEPEIVESEIVEISNEISVREEPKNDENINFGKTFREIPRVQILSLPAVGCTHQVAVPPNHTYVPPERRTSQDALKFPFPLDGFQQEAIACVEDGQSVLVSAHTSSGKTVVALYAISLAFRERQRVVYTSPIKALSNQKYRELCQKFLDVGLLTGDVTINPSGNCLVMTTEILRSMLYRGSELLREVGWVIFDEIHYMRDKERGVVWEESIILLPDNVRYIFLSATIPNASQFAEWITFLHKQNCHVISTEFRPVPLQHYIYPAGGDGIYLVLNKDDEFMENCFHRAMKTIDKGTSLTSADMRGRKGGVVQKFGINFYLAGSALHKLIRLIMEKNLSPVIVFSFSRKECEVQAMEISSLDLTDSREKFLIQDIFHNAIALLSEEDRKLPQIESLLPILRNGIGIHHSGLLPIIKEALFATETFSMGLNMPAKTVLFTAVRKFDGKVHRWLSSGEYIQMSGRAGRRGLDLRGVVILMLESSIGADVAKNIIKGEADPLNSEFRLTYNMVLNLFRVEGINPEFMLERSFFQFQKYSTMPALYEKAEKIRIEVENLIVPKENKLLEYWNVKKDIECLQEKMLAYISKPNYIAPFLMPGRLLHIRTQRDVFGWGVLINFRRLYCRRRNLEVNPEFVVDVLLPVSPASYTGRGDIECLRPAVPGQKAKIETVPILLHCISKISSIRVRYPHDLRSDDSRNSVLNTLTEVKRRFPESKGGIPLLDPIADMNINDEKFIEMHNQVQLLKTSIDEMDITKDPLFKDYLEKFEEKQQLLNKLTEANENLRNTRNLIHLDELHRRKRVLRALGYANKQDVITLKGRVACEISVADELLLTEMLFEGVFNELSTEKCASLLSCFVCQEKVESAELPPEFRDLLNSLHKIAKRIAQATLEANLEIDETDYLQSFKPYMMQVVHAWCLGESFFKITGMTTIFEGSIIRCIRRLEELLREMASAARAMGNEDLETKFNDACSCMKRDIIFAASLYL
ncbi:Superkiller viralicidic activity 2-like 2 [Trichinella pseudospiralis]|uniref:Superkiller viralicidic activity 2-like 2 n=2 Tax=Trichinella pseudospiralis TaxID=6337 RepID=A0A0V0YAM4_TRIPS|nr:Superkiller viralicidic activity 2-like 2 [Trichinella pseudospiralis]